MPAGAQSINCLLYRVPSVIRFLLKGPQVDIYLHLVFALEVAWHSPRVPADAASAIGEFAGGKNLSRLVDNLHSGGSKLVAILSYPDAVLLACLAND